MVLLKWAVPSAFLYGSINMILRDVGADSAQRISDYDPKKVTDAERIFFIMELIFYNWREDSILSYNQPDRHI